MINVFGLILVVVFFPFSLTLSLVVEVSMRVFFYYSLLRRDIFRYKTLLKTEHSFLRSGNIFLLEKYDRN